MAAKRLSRTECLSGPEVLKTLYLKYVNGEPVSWPTKIVSRDWPPAPRWTMDESIAAMVKRLLTNTQMLSAWEQFDRYFAARPDALRDVEYICIVGMIIDAQHQAQTIKQLSKRRRKDLMVAAGEAAQTLIGVLDELGHDELRPPLYDGHRNEWRRRAAEHMHNKLMWWASTAGPTLGLDEACRKALPVVFNIGYCETVLMTLQLQLPPAPVWIRATMTALETEHVFAIPTPKPNDSNAEVHPFQRLLHRHLFERYGVHFNEAIAMITNVVLRPKRLATAPAVARLISKDRVWNQRCAEERAKMRAMLGGEPVGFSLERALAFSEEWHKNGSTA